MVSERVDSPVCHVSIMSFLPFLGAEKLEERKMLENAAECHTSGARFVSPLFVCKDFMTETSLP